MTEMIQVISRGNDAAFKQVICLNCGAELKYARIDIETRQITDYTGDIDTVYFITCPDCHNKITVKQF